MPSTLPKHSTEFREELCEIYEAMVSGSYEGLIKKLKHLNDEGVPEASLYLGYMHREGLGTLKDLTKALAYFARSSQLGLELAALYAARAAEKLKDVKQAEVFYRAAAMKGNASAAYSLFRMSDNGIISMNSSEKEGYLMQAYKGGHAYAHKDLVKMMLKGKYGIVARFKAVPMAVNGVFRMAMKIASDQKSDLLH